MCSAIATVLHTVDDFRISAGGYGIRSAASNGNVACRDGVSICIGSGDGDFIRKIR